MRAARYLSPLRKLCSKIEPLRTRRSLALMTAPARASLMCSTETISNSSPSISKTVPARKSLVEIKQVLQREKIAAGPEPGDDGASRRCRHARTAKTLRAPEKIGQVNLDHRHCQSFQAVVERVRV